MGNVFRPPFCHFTAQTTAFIFIHFFFRLGFAIGSPVIEKGRVLSVFFSYRLAKEMILFELNFLIKVGFK